MKKASSAGLRVVARSFLVSLVAICCVGCKDDVDHLHCGPPVVACGEDQAATVGDVVVLRGGVKLPPEDQEVCIVEKESLLYEWQQVAGSSVGIHYSDNMDAYFVPLHVGEYIFRFRATYPVTVLNHEIRHSEWDYTTVTVAPIICRSPSAEAGEDQVLTLSSGASTEVLLDGSRSHAAGQFGCERLSITGYNWTVANQPAGADVGIIGAGSARARANLSVEGTYEFQLEVQDSGGTVDRTDTDADTVEVTLLPSPVCETGLVVTVVDARDRNPVEGAHVTVVDVNEVIHTKDTNASGTARFDSLNPGNRRSITAVSDEMVPVLPDGTGWERPRFEITTVLDQCSSEITIPLRSTASGEAARPRGTVTAKVPRSIFEMLPHSWKCAGECTGEHEYECDDDYYCELEDIACKNLCTPKSLLPFFSLRSPNVSGQTRFAWLVPVFSSRDPSFEQLFSVAVEGGPAVPGNLAIDDTFLNGLGRSFGVDPWGEACERTIDCPDQVDYICEQNPLGDYRCRDRSPLRNFRMDVEAGQGLGFLLVSGIADIDFAEFRPVIVAVFNWDYQAGIGIFDFLQSLEAKTLFVCPFVADVAAGQDNDVTPALAAISEDDCWSVDYTQKDSIVALNIPGSGAEACSSDADCCDSSGKHCGYPESGRKCLQDPSAPGEKKCFSPMFPVEVFSDDQVTVEPSGAGFDPAADRSDERLCSLLPEYAPFEELCDTETPDVYESCYPQRIHDLDVPDDAECFFTKGMTLMALDFPEGHSALPGGGLAFIGFDFHRSIEHRRNPSFFVPSFEGNGLDGASLVVFQSYVRNAKSIPDGRFQALPGRLKVKTPLGSIPEAVSMPEFLQVPAQTSVPDAGFEVSVFFIPEDPTVWPNPVLERTYSVAEKMSDEISVTHALPETLVVSTPPESELTGLVLSKVDREDVYIVDNDWSWDPPLVIKDPLWRIYAPAGTTSFSIPPELNPFSRGDEVWVTPWSSSFSTPFEYDLFLIDQILNGQSSYAQDSYATLMSSP
jgi:hypothetical protein